MLQEVEINKKILRHFALPGERGLFVSKIEPDSPASRSQLDEGDIIVCFNGQRVENIHALFKALGDQNILKMIDAEVLRYDKRLMMPITPAGKAA